MVLTRFSVPALLVASLVSPAIAASEGTTFEFSTCGASGRTGPSQTQCNNAYQGTSLENKVEVVGEGIQEWTVPEDGTYRITALGSVGEPDKCSNGYSSGRGAVIQGNFALEKGETLNIVVGQTDRSGCLSNNDAGGGGSFVAEGKSYSSASPLIVAGGGGGAGAQDAGQDAEMATFGGDSVGMPGGTDGGGGEDGVYEYGKPGAGYVGNANGNDKNGVSQHARSFQNGALGSEAGECSISNSIGGFGGAGGGSDCGTAGSGGGGYSGGAAGCDFGDSECPDQDNGGGGGGSFIHAEAENPATSDGTWDTTGTEPHPVYTGDPESLDKFNSGPGYVKVKLVQGSGPGFCNFRGPRNQCVSNQTNFLSQSSFDVSSALLVEPSAVFQSSLSQPLINVSNSTRLSGEWRGGFEVSSSSSPVIGAGASLEPGEEDIVIGK